MQTIHALYGIVVVFGLVLVAVYLFVRALSLLGARHENAIEVGLDGRRLRLSVSIKSTRSRNGSHPTAQDGDDAVPLVLGEKIIRD